MTVAYRRPSRTDELRPVEITGRVGDYWQRYDGQARVLFSALMEPQEEGTVNAAWPWVIAGVAVILVFGIVAVVQGMGT